MAKKSYVFVGTLVASALLFCTIGTALADTLILKSGETFEGKVIIENDKKVVFEFNIQGSKGTITLDREKVSEIIIASPLDEEYTKRLQNVKPGDAKYQFELAKWCQEQGLVDRALIHYKKTLELSADHEGARQAIYKLDKKSRTDKNVQNDKPKNKTNSTPEPAPKSDDKNKKDFDSYGSCV